MFEVPPNYVASGQYICWPTLANTISLAGPCYAQASPLEPERIAQGNDATQLLNSYAKEPSCYTMQQPVVRDYAAAVVRAIRAITELNYEIILCPIRGARMPGIECSVMSSKPGLFQAFDGTGMAQGVNDTRIIAELKTILLHSPPQADPRRIAVLDTAKGGDSCRACARLLGIINQDARQAWNVTFHLLHARGRTPARSRQPYDFKTPQFHPAVHYHDVTDLLIEDEANLLGYSAERADSEIVSRRFQQDGTILYHDGRSVTQFRKAPLDEVMIGIVGQEIARELNSLPDVSPVDLGS